MPLTWLQDFAGPMARTTSDIARILNATTGTDPDDLFTLHNNAGEKRPADYKTALDRSALQGKRIGYLPASFTGSPSYGQADGTMEAVTARFADIEAAGATMVELTTQPPSGPATGTLTGNRTEEGWQQYFDLHENPPYTTASGILSSPKVLPYNRQTVAGPPAHDGGGHPEGARRPRRLQGPHQDLDGRRTTSTPSSTRASARTSTTTTAPRRCRATATAAC